ncbi:helix-turn-helix domain-containing protein, partial [Ornithobacterium rhinotracheale]
MANKEKFIELVSDTVSDTVERAKLRKARRRQLRLSQKIALNILKRIEELGWKQKDLAEKMGVSPQQVSKW